MYIPKKYGQSKIEKCPFCGDQAITMNKQQIPVCKDHKDELLQSLKCVCGEHLDILHGKYGAFCNCMNCGNMTLRKALEMNNLE